MTAQTHSLADLLAFLCLGVGGWASGSALLYLICDADLADFDPRPAVRRAVKAAHQAAVDAGHALNWQIAAVERRVRIARRDAAISLAAFLALFSAPVPAPKGALR